jgi:hypothetical protein
MLMLQFAFHLAYCGGSCLVIGSGPEHGKQLVGTCILPRLTLLQLWTVESEGEDEPRYGGCSATRCDKRMDELRRQSSGTVPVAIPLRRSPRGLTLVAAETGTSGTSLPHLTFEPSD